MGPMRTPWFLVTRTAQTLRLWLIWLVRPGHRRYCRYQPASRKAGVIYVAICMRYSCTFVAMPPSNEPRPLTPILLAPPPSPNFSFLPTTQARHAAHLQLDSTIRFNSDLGIPPQRRRQRKEQSRDQLHFGGFLIRLFNVNADRNAFCWQIDGWTLR